MVKKRKADSFSRNVHWLMSEAAAFQGWNKLENTLILLP